MKRRNFLKTSALASTSLLVPGFLKGFTSDKQYNSRTGKILVVIQLSGGNDGLNTVIPYQNDLYYKNRPTLAIKKPEVLSLNDEQGLNPAMESLKSLYDEGLLSIINKVGYPNPDRSHFRSMDIWHTASDSDQYLRTGWLGRYLDHSCQGQPQSHLALEISNNLSLALKGDMRKGFAMNDAKHLHRNARNPFLKTTAENPPRSIPSDNLNYLYKTLIDTQASAEYLFQQSKVHPSKIKYPPNAFGKKLKQIAELITADTDTKIYYISLNGFDTHANQKNAQARLLKQYSDGMKAFVKDLKTNGLLEDTLIMTFSEFGRRVKQNASNGTDHGTANNMFFIGSKLKKPGIYNAAPRLDQLDNGDLIHEIDFRNIYATVLDKWLGSDPKRTLGRKFKGEYFI